MLLTLSTCFYIVDSKFNPSVYIDWMTNMVSIVQRFNLVLYTDLSTFTHVGPLVKDHPNIKVIIKPMNEFHNYKYKDHWIVNHERNISLKHTSWELNMIWAEKTSFVKETMEQKYFHTEFYGWCDIGYFRNRCNDTHTSKLINVWPNEEVLNSLDKTKVHYGCVNNDEQYLRQLANQVQDRNEFNLPKQPISPSQISVAGGFFIVHATMVQWWFCMFDETLRNYFTHEYLVKDDQTIIVDCAFTHPNKFNLLHESSAFDNWFMFQRILYGSNV